MSEHPQSYAKRPFAAIQSLHTYIVKEHVVSGVLVGPDSGVRWNFRLGRFVKSYLPALPWRDRYVFQQAQGYWILANWRLWELTTESEYAAHARRGADAMAAAQQRDGSWEYPPMRSRRGLIATVEGDMAAIALAESFRREQQPTWINSALSWHAYLVSSVGFRQSLGGTAVNYWANRPEAVVPNNTSLTLWALAALTVATGDGAKCSPCRSMLAFLDSAQLETGELPYVVDPNEPEGDRTHFLCYQYNAFECLDLIHYYGLTGDRAALSIIERLANFLATGITKSGAVKYDCRSEKPVVPYYAAAVAAALSSASRIGLGEYRSQADQIYDWVRSQQAADGGMKYFSRRDYAILTDRRSYPRNLAMILYHLVLDAETHWTPATMQEANGI